MLQQDSFLFRVSSDRRSVPGNLVEAEEGISMPYSVKEIYYTLQGEGVRAGRPAVFCRFAGCNLWSGREKDRESAVCRFCDTDFVGTDGIGGGRFASPGDLARAVLEQWPPRTSGQQPYVVCTGGEPLLQLDTPLVDSFHDLGLEIAIETNGTILAPDGIDWVCVSPKAGSELVQISGDELKLVFPQVGLPPASLEPLQFEHHLLQPMDGPHRDSNTQLALRYCLENPRWRLSLQTHKLIGIP